MIASIVILPAAFVSGVQFSLLIGLLGQGDKDVGKQVGLAFGWNTVGAICGALAGGFGLLPLLSAPGVWRRSRPSWRSSALSVARLRLATGEDAGSWAVTTVGAGIVAAGMIACPGPDRRLAARRGRCGTRRRTGILADPNALHDWENAVRRSVFGRPTGSNRASPSSRSDGLAFYVNGMCDGNAIEDVGTQIMLGLIGGALHPQPRTALSSAWERERRPAGWRKFRRSSASTSSSWSRRSGRWRAAAARSIATSWRIPRCD